MKRRVLAVILSIACLTSIFTGCSLKKSNESKKKTVVTLVYNQKLNNFEKYVESKLPDVDSAVGTYGFQSAEHYDQTAVKSRTWPGFGCLHPAGR